MTRTLAEATSQGPHLSANDEVSSGRAQANAGIHEAGDDGHHLQPNFLRHLSNKPTSDGLHPKSDEPSFFLIEVQWSDAFLVSSEVCCIVCGSLGMPAFVRVTFLCSGSLSTTLFSCVVKHRVPGKCHFLHVLDRQEKSSTVINVDA